MEPILTNPMNKAIKTISSMIKEAKIKSFMDILPKIFMFLSYFIALAICCVFWLYGWFSVLEQLFRYLISNTVNSIKKSENSNLENVPLYITTGVFFLFGIPFALLISPLYIIGFFSAFLFKYKLSTIFAFFGLIIIFVFVFAVITYLISHKYLLF